MIEDSVLLLFLLFFVYFDSTPAVCDDLLLTRVANQPPRARCPDCSSKFPVRSHSFPRRSSCPSHHFTLPKTLPTPHSQQHNTHLTKTKQHITPLSWQADFLLFAFSPTLSNRRPFTRGHTTSNECFFQLAWSVSISFLEIVPRSTDAWHLPLTYTFFFFSFFSLLLFLVFFSHQTRRPSWT